MTIQQGDTVTFIFTMLKKSTGGILDLSNASVMIIKFRPVSTGSTIEQTAVWDTDGTDGRMRYTTLTTDLSVASNWDIQPYVETPEFIGHGHKEQFLVEDIL